MRKVTAAVMASTLTLSIFSFTSEAVTPSVWQADEALIPRISIQNHMFDGIRLTEQQRQQLRDLMQQARHERPSVNVSEMETMHSLVTAENFDEQAVRAYAEKMAQEQIKRQVEMARVRNQMYHLLTQEQQTELSEKHRERMQQLRERSAMSSPVPQIFSSARSNQ